MTRRDQDNGRTSLDPAREGGAAHGRRIAFIHGLAGSGASFSRLDSCWEAPTHGIFLDMPWSASISSGPLGEIWPLECNDPQLLADALARVGPAPEIILAHSFGALVTLEALSRGLIAKPRALVLIAPFYRSRGEDFSWATLDYYVTDFHLVLAEGLSVASSRPPSPDHIEEMALKVRECIGPIGWMHFFRAYVSTPHLDLSKIDVPVLIIAGAKDISAFPDDARALAAALPHGTCEILAECGHFAFLETPECVAAMIESFCETMLSDVERIVP